MLTRTASDRQRGSTAVTFVLALIAVLLAGQTYMQADDYVRRQRVLEQVQQVVADIETQRVLAVTGVGSEPSRIVITPDQQYALVLNRGSGDMAVIRTAAIAPGRAKSAPLFTMVPVGARPFDAVVLGEG